MLCIQEHFLTACSLGLVKISPSYSTYSVPAKSIHSRGRPSSSITTLVTTDLKSRVFESNDNYIAVRMKNTVIINVNLPTDYRDENSERSFALASEKPSSRIKKMLAKLSFPCIIMGDFNCDLSRDPAEWSMQVSLTCGIFGDSIYIVPKDSNVTYIHPSSNTSNLDHVAVSCELILPIIKVLSDCHVSDDLPIAASFRLSNRTLPTATHGVGHCLC